MSAIISAGGPSSESLASDDVLCPLSDEASLSLSEPAALSPPACPFDLRFCKQDQHRQGGT
jgi:hypothetical protein